MLKRENRLHAFNYHRDELLNYILYFTIRRDILKYPRLSPLYICPPVYQPQHCLTSNFSERLFQKKFVQKMLFRKHCAVINRDVYVLFKILNLRWFKTSTNVAKFRLDRVISKQRLFDYGRNS